MVFNSLPSAQANPGFGGVLNVLQNANLAVTDLEENLLDFSSNVPRADSPDTVRWPHGTKSQAEDLKRAGFSVGPLANDHALDYGVDGIDQITIFSIK